MKRNLILSVMLIAGTYAMACTKRYVSGILVSILARSLR